MTNREIDALIAEKVMGWQNSNSLDVEDRTYTKDGEHVMYVDDFRPTESISDAWIVVERFAKDGKSLRVEYNSNFNEWICSNQSDESIPLNGWSFEDELFSQYQATAPLAICLVALKAVGITV